LGTTAEYFEHYRYGQRRPLEFAEGQAFEGVYGAVLGAQVARQLGYTLGEEIIIAHGTGSVSFTQHDDHPLIVVGILKPTGTPVDRTLHVSLEGIEAIHIGWESGVPTPGQRLDPARLLEPDLPPQSITAVLVGLNSRAATFGLQRQINDYRGEALMAILPGVALAELWQMLAMVENLLYLITFLVLLATLIGMMTTLLASMKERQREMAILRAVGASPLYLFWLVELEVLLLAVLGVLGGVLLLSLGLWLAQPALAAQFGLFIAVNPLQAQTPYIAAGIVILAGAMGLMPAIAAYRRALVEGMSQRL
jgi:putative ABC transport system permease protein